MGDMGLCPPASPCSHGGRGLRIWEGIGHRAWGKTKRCGETEAYGNYKSQIIMTKVSVFSVQVSGWMEVSVFSVQVSVSMFLFPDT